MGKKSRIFLKKKSAIGIIQFGLSNFFSKILSSSVTQIISKLWT